MRLRIVDGARLNPDTIMPSYYRTDGLQRVARNFEGKTILSAAQVEDVVAYLVNVEGLNGSTVASSPAPLPSSSSAACARASATPEAMAAAIKKVVGEPRRPRAG